MRHSSEGDSLVSAPRPVARLLVLCEDEEKSSALNGRARGANAMKRVGEIAAGAGHIVGMANEPLRVEDETPEVVLIDGASYHAVEMLERAQRDDHTLGAAFVALMPPRARDELFEALRASGASEFLAADAAPFEIVARLEAVISLARSRPEIAALRDQLARQMRVDDLTGAMSRRFFFQQAHRECSRARRYGHRLSCVMIEIDHFKSLCATFGDAAGEGVLRAASALISQWTRDSDLVARFTDAKFALLLPETGIGGATRAQDKITSALAAHKWHFNGNDLPVTVSIGESELLPGATFGRVADDYVSQPDDEKAVSDAALSTRESLARLLEDADAALFVARRGARVPDVFVPYVPVPGPLDRPRRPRPPARDQ